MFRLCRGIPFFMLTGVAYVSSEVERGIGNGVSLSLSEGFSSGMTDGPHGDMRYCINIQFVDCR